MSGGEPPGGCLGFLFKIFGFGPSDGDDVGDGRGGGRSVPLPYRIRDPFLSPAELAFDRVLREAVGTRFMISYKVRLWDLLTVPRSGEPKTGSKDGGSRTFENKIRSKHVDFLLCEPDTVRPRLVVELDDASHRRKDRRERDRFVDEAFAAAGLPILHVPAAAAYSIGEVRSKIEGLVPPEASSVGTPPASEQPPSITDRKSATTSSTTPDSGGASVAPSCPKCHAAMVKRKAAKGKHAGKRFWACANYPKCREIIGID